MENLTTKEIAAIRAIDEFLYQWGDVDKMFEDAAKAMSQLLYLSQKTDEDISSVVNLAQVHTMLLDVLRKFEDDE